MVFRKIIGFGNSSFVVSLPKSWIQKNGLKKGDAVSLEEEGNFIKFSPGTLKQTNTNSEWKIHFDGNVKKLKAELLYAYTNNYNTITILGKKVHASLDSIKNIIKDFMYLDIIDQTSEDKVVLKSSINLYDISVYDIIRRMDRIVLSMSEDVRNYLAGKNIKVEVLVKNKEENINKLCNFVFKTLKTGFNPNDRAILNLDINDIFYYWELALFVEKVGDQIKRIPRLTKPNIPQQLLNVFDEVILQYSDAMKSNFTRDIKLAIDVIFKKRDTYTKLEGLLPALDKEHIILSEKIGTINNYTGSISKSLIRLRSGNMEN